MDKLGFNYPLYVAKFGDNDPSKKKILITSQIHGNEPVGTEAILDMMQQFATADKDLEKILDEVTIWFMPRINPDGPEVNIDGKNYAVRYVLQNWDPEVFGLDDSTKTPYYFNVGRAPGQGNVGSVYHNIPGFDENRDFSPNLDFRLTEGMESLLNGPINNSNAAQPGFFVTPEARIVSDVYEELQPDIYIDLHHKGFSVDDNNKPISIEISGDMVDKNKTYESGGKSYKVNEDVDKLSKQVNVAAYQALGKYKSHIGAVERYDDSVDSPGSALGTFKLNGSGIMIMEIKGQTQNLGQKQHGALVKAVREGLYGVIESVSDNSIYDIDTTIYDNIPISPPDRISDPTVRPK